MEEANKLELNSYINRSLPLISEPSFTLYFCDNNKSGINKELTLSSIISQQLVVDSGIDLEALT